MRRDIHTPDTRGFTAIELAMVASVIAIIALLILPLFRNRSEEAKYVAARDDLQSLAKALLMTEADTGKFFRLMDLDRGIASTTNQDHGIPMVWSGTNPLLPGIPWVTLSENDRARITPELGNVSSTIGASLWRGPYISFQKSVTYQTLRITRPQLFVDFGGPIYDLLGAGQGYPYPGGAITDPPGKRVPVDPWGMPYLFINLSETGYGPRILYSMGPNGVPGDGTPVPLPYRSSRVGGLLGLGDDLEFIF